MKAITRFINEKAHAWALHRQGEDERSVTLNTRRVYILPTHQGIAFGVLLLAMLLASLNYNNSLGLALTFLLGGLAIVAMHHCHHNMVGLTIRFSAVEPVFAGQRAEFRFALEGRGQHERFQFQLHTDLARPGDDPQLIYSVIGDVPAAESSTLILSVPTHRRGTHALARVGLSTRYPFGLFRAWSWLHMECAALVYPRPAPDAPALPAGAGDSGGRQDEKRGEEDFAGLRAFQEGDSPRHIAWKAYARDEEPRVKQYAGVAVSSTWIDFDTLSEPDPELRLEQLTRQVLDAQAANQPYGLRLPPGVVIAPQLGEAHQERCLAALALCQLTSANATITSTEGLVGEPSSRLAEPAS
ncbi:MAG: DUF58 domain-containing protein [Pseudomonadota bacterium]